LVLGLILQLKYIALKPLTNYLHKILITGANGYLGAHLAARLMDSGHDVLLSDRAPKSKFNYSNYIQEDLQNPINLGKLLKDVKIVFFFTGKTGAADESFNNPKDFIVGNEVTLTNLLQYVKGLSDKPKMIFPSTRLLYKGLDASQLSEDSELEAKTVYAVNKLACENYLDLYQRCFDIDYLIFRISLPYGSFIDNMKASHGVMSFLIENAQQSKPLKMFGDGMQIGSFIHVSDLVDIILKGALNESIKNEIFNVGGHDNLTMKKVMFEIASKFKVKVEQVDWPKLSGCVEHGDLILNSSKLEKATNFTYRYRFVQWLKNL
jgi:UDP-glucose 4-epimerase